MAFRVHFPSEMGKRVAVKLLLKCPEVQYYEGGRRERRFVLLGCMSAVFTQPLRWLPVSPGYGRKIKEAGQQ